MVSVGETVGIVIPGFTMAMDDIAIAPARPVGFLLGDFVPEPGVPGEVGDIEGVEASFTEERRHGLRFLPVLLTE